MEYLEFLKETINLPLLKPQSGIFGFLQTDQELFLFLNYLLLLFKYYLYYVSFAALKRNVKKRSFWKNLSKYDETKKSVFLKNWGKVLIYF